MPVPPAATKKLIAELTGLYATIGIIVGGVDKYTGTLIMMSAEQRATELVNVARHHKKMMDFLKAMTASNDYLACIMGHGMMAYAILAHFDRVPQTPALYAMGLAEEQMFPEKEETLNGSAAGFAGVA